MNQLWGRRIPWHDWLERVKPLWAANDIVFDKWSTHGYQGFSTTSAQLPMPHSSSWKSCLSCFGSFSKRHWARSTWWFHQAENSSPQKTEESCIQEGFLPPNREEIGSVWLAFKGVNFSVPPRHHFKHSAIHYHLCHHTHLVGLTNSALHQKFLQTTNQVFFVFWLCIYEKNKTKTKQKSLSKTQLTSCNPGVRRLSY